MGVSDVEDKFKLVNLDRFSSSIKVTIWCTTFNHVNYIEKAIEGFISQETSFEYEVIIFDDASVDGTTNIVEEYANKHPDKIKAIIAKKNTYRSPDRRALMAEIKRRFINGAYISYCEGDDYWIYSKKLQRQYDLLEQNGDISMCIHNAIRVNGSEVLPQIIDMDTHLLDDEEVFFCNNGRPPTASFFCRTEYVRELEKTVAYQMCPVGDDLMRYFFNTKGKILYLDKCWAVRNYMHDGSWNSQIKDNEALTEYYMKYFDYLKQFDKETADRYIKYTSRMKMDFCIGTCDALTKMCKSVFDYHEVIMKCITFFGEEYHDKLLQLWVGNNMTFSGYEDYLCNLSQKQKLYIYGAGVVAERMYRALLRKGCHVEGVVVTDVKNQNQELLGNNVVCVDDIDVDDGVCFVLAMNKKNRLEVARSLLEKGIRKFM